MSDLLMTPHPEPTGGSSDDDSLLVIKQRERKLALNQSWLLCFATPLLRGSMTPAARS